MVDVQDLHFVMVCAFMPLIVNESEFLVRFGAGYGQFFLFISLQLEIILTL
jgi:hypothetical protein